jgi:murein L,D-transpeptidase YafK
MSHTFRPALLCILAIVVVAPRNFRAQTQTKIPDRILILKSAHTMSLMHGTEILKTYKVALSTVPVGAKERAGDHRVPEGIYIVDRKNPQSQFHLALHVSYPNATDRARASKLGVDPGGNIEIHGLEKKYAPLGALHRTYDWTDGCIAVTDAEIEEIYPQIRVGTPVEIRP